MRLLIIRISSMGDVALITPLIKGLRESYPEVELTVVTRKAYLPFFYSTEGISFVTPDFTGRHKGIRGLFRLFRDIRSKGRIDHVIDLHDVLRTKVLRILFRLTGVPVSVIDKGRGEKRSLIRGRRKIQLKHVIERYHDVFSSAGFQISTGDGPWIIPSQDAIVKADKILDNFNGSDIGVAPYAKHPLKVWPEENMIKLLELISAKQRTRFWLLGGKEDAEKLNALELRIRDSVNIAGRISLDEELALITRLDFVIAMDSANMHIAALAGTPVISIWGGTDPMSGFGSWMQPVSYSVKIPVEQLACRPCTVYGKGNCRRGDLACMKGVLPEMVFEKISATGLLGGTKA